MNFKKKKSLKCQIVLSKIMPTEKEIDRVGGVYSQQEFKKVDFI